MNEKEMKLRNEVAIKSAELLIRVRELILIIAERPESVSDDAPTEHLLEGANMMLDDLRKIRIGNRRNPAYK